MFLKYPFYGSRQMTQQLRRAGEFGVARSNIISGQYRLRCGWFRTLRIVAEALEVAGIDLSDQRHVVRVRGLLDFGSLPALG